ncbi:MAG: ABC transporter permease, partial [Acidobacteriota bacterium]
MRKITDLIFRLKAFFRPAAMEKELDDEMAFHLEMATAKNIERGLTPQAARRAAEESFGSLLRGKQQARDAWGIVLLQELCGDGRFAVRQMLRRPSSTLLAAMVLGLGIGGTVALWSAVHGLLLRPMPYADEERLVVFWSDGDWMEVEYDHALAKARAYDEIAAFTWTSTPLRSGEVTTLLEEGLVTGNLFEALGAEPFLGRALEPADSFPGAPGVMVLSHGLWSQEMGGDPDVVGTHLSLDGEPVTVVGVMPSGFFFPFPQVRAWRPLQIDPASDNYASNGYLALLGKVQSGLTAEQLTGDVATVAAALGERFDYPDAWDKSKGAHVLPLREFLFGRLRPALLLLMGAVTLLWLTACANVAALVVTRTADRQEEMAVRAALGAGRGRLARQLLTESILLALTGAAVGVGIAVVLFDVVVARLPLPYGFGETLALDGSSLAVALVLACLAALAAALFPLRTLLSGSAIESLRTRGGGRRTAQGFLVFAETALAVVLLTGAALLIRSVGNLRDVDPGLDPAGVLAVDLVLSSSEMGEVDGKAFFDAAVERAAALPGVVAAG